MDFFEKAVNSLEGTEDAKYESCEKKTLKNGKNVLRVKGDFCKAYRLWISCEKDGELRKLPFNVAQIDVEGNTIISPLLEMLTGGTFLAGENRYKDGLYEYVLVGEKGSKKIRKYVHADTNIFNFFATNGKGNFNGLDLDVRPKMNIIINCIDREDKEWHEENKKCKLLGNSKTSLGISYGIWKEMVSVGDDYGSIWEYDINIKKFIENEKGREITRYRAKRADPDISDLAEFVVIGGLTEEEKKYEEYDVYEEGKISSANYILKYLGDRIKEADEVLGTDYYTQLKEQCVSNEDDEGIEKTKETVEQIVTSTRRTRKKKEESNEKEMDFGDLQVEECLNSNCKKEFPVEWDKCPFCGEEYNLD